ncbi:MAG: imidazole glycerol phosphate synthase subunit HisH [Planctomycetota bacterium]|nr:MAG: imidazole glycerol phosphate synthase subunit HisH [Planctomycetota bacterium]
MTIAIIDYRAGNLTSVQRALAHLGCESLITDDYDTIMGADKVIFPGVGAAASCMQALHETGCGRALADVAAAQIPLLGICVGMQLLFEHSEEDGGVDCLGLIPGSVRRFQPSDPSLKVPHMGWNPIQHDDDPLWLDVPETAAMYFVHSYYCQPAASVHSMATSDHGIPFCAGVRHGSIRAVQFHPEKSGPLGLQVLRNFINE